MSDGITCKEMVELMSDYLEDALSAEDRARFEEHLGICEGCTNYLVQIKETIRLTGMLTEEQIPPEQKAKLLDAFRSWRS